MTGKLGHVAVRVKDMDRAIDYYLSLGFNLQWESDDWSFFEEGIALLGPGYNRAEPVSYTHLTLPTILLV